ncbi:ImmA/IrrE family metallo-endopeptidase [Mesorhizobium sp. BR115XR7A]|uniref:ImmA/IrrE family metallo-endopeptidase n=1 Tax=Mesorhizobium sp. BR115XR7A TaxID=2876645 RepID=UPI001CC99FCA|nr:ImmA/IrrE family metallo-endopeptidase [Mesorhizobium sp. BR115XR7A]MBZ9904670.1 ImmA/IrrE family metallo-endopeptidase [Mesorhizobium sp. BR115XR7A]MBZ9932873.1 ImmA/IrrE family metallo-endopeptidase [Mesorhizobium sp. BR1-1-5]
MADEFYVGRALSASALARIADAVRAKFGVADKTWVDVIDIVELELPKIIKDYSFVVKSDKEMTTPAYTDYNPVSIVVSESVYIAACEGDDRSRMTIAHELGHVLLHSDFFNSKFNMHRSEHSEKRIAQATGMHSSEYQAKRFAAYILAPQSISKKYSDPKKLASDAGISIAAARIAIKDANKYYI